MTYEEAIEIVKAIASDLADAESTLSDLSDIEGLVEEAKSYLENATSELDNIVVPDVSDLDLDGLKDRLDDLAESLETLAPPTIKGLTLLVKQGSAEQRFYLHPDTPVQIEIITE
jgi:uncharacterized phage infection (PIP) family protein YhgE